MPNYVQHHVDSERTCTNCGERNASRGNYCGFCGAFITREQNIIPPETNNPNFAGFWIRLFARLIDELFITLVFGMLVSIIGMNDFTAFALVIINFSYFVLMTKSRGQTLGKMALGIQVVDANGNIPSAGTILLREIPCKILSALPLYLGYAWTGWDERKRSWHDHLSKTFVIKKPRQPD